MIITEYVKTKWTTLNRKHYEELGYVFTKYMDDLIVKVTHLPLKSNIIIEYRCNWCNKIASKTYGEYIEKILNGEQNHCRNCANKTPFEDIIAFYKKHGCTLLSKKEEYHDERTKLKFICKCGREYESSYASFKIVGNCRECGNKKFRGENHYNWQGGISSDRDAIKRSKEYIEWRNKVYERDNYTCQACGDSKGRNLHAHHIENYSSNPDKRFDINNGITLCNDCHNPRVIGSFHNIYGTKNNTKEQLENYIALKKSGHLDALLFA